MPLNPQVEALLQMMAQMPALDFATASPADIRAVFDNPIPLAAPPSVARIEDISIALDGRNLGARLYVPEGAGELPALTLYYHGGGWVIGTLDTHDGTCRALAQKSGNAVLSIAYRLAPEHRYPAAADDCYDALVWAAANAEGYVLRPNVDTLVEAMDMREAQRAYEANLNIIETARAMDARTLDLLKK